MTSEELEIAACTPRPLDSRGFNSHVKLPYGLAVDHVANAMNDFLDFLGFINNQLRTRGVERLEAMLMQANFSSLVGEFMASAIPKHCPTIVKNRFHNGHPDLLPAGVFPRDAVRYADEGIEIKASRRPSGWQGHNPEDAWLMVFVFDANAQPDAANAVAPKPFRFLGVYGARITKADWNFSGRGEASRRTPTASVTRSGYEKMVSNYIYKAPQSTSEGTPSLFEPPPIES